MSILSRLTVVFSLALALGAHAAEVVLVSHWELHNSFWMSLHHTLIDDAMRTTPFDLSALKPEERTAWTEAVAAYKTAGGTGDMTFSKSMVITNDGLTQVADDAVDPIIDAPLADTLKRAAPIYRAHWWPADEKANRFFIAYAASMLREAGEDLVRAHEKAYRTPWPERIRLYIAPAAGPYGAYTMYGLVGGWITTMSHRDEGYQGLRALEMIFHEASHTVVNPNRGTVAEAIAAAAKKRGIRQPHDLWHALLFATSSELTRRYLAERGTKFVPSSEDLFTRAWPFYRAAVEKYWLPYLDGKGTLEEAIDQIVGALPQPTK